MFCKLGPPRRPRPARPRAEYRGASHIGRAGGGSPIRPAGQLPAAFLRGAHYHRQRLGAVLSVAGIGLLVWTVIEAPRHGWTSAVTLASFAGSLAILAGFALWQVRRPDPMLDVRLFAGHRRCGRRRPGVPPGPGQATPSWQYGSPRPDKGARAGPGRIRGSAPWLDWATWVSRSQRRINPSDRRSARPRLIAGKTIPN